MDSTQGIGETIEMRIAAKREPAAGVIEPAPVPGGLELQCSPCGRICCSRARGERLVLDL